MASQNLLLLLRLQRGYSSMKILIRIFLLMPNLVVEEVDIEDTKEEGVDIINRVEEATSSLQNRKKLKTITKYLE